MSDEIRETSASESDGGKAQARPPEADLSPKQLLALQALVAGKGITKAAFAAGVNRTTLFRWRKEQPAFNAAMTAWIDTTMQSAQSLLMESIETAARAVVDAAENGDAYIGLEMLRGVGLILRSRDRSAATGKEPTPTPPAATGLKPGEGMGGGLAATPAPPSIPPG
jgi:hypothetical protein